MKKELIAAFSLGLALTFVGCSDDSSSSSSAEDIEKIDDNGGKSGNFGKFSAIDDDAEEVLKAAVKGSDYESVTCDSVSAQIVAGTNYKFQCSIKDGKETKDVVLTVFEPLPNSDKPVQLTFVTDADGEVLFESEVEFEAEDEESDDEKSDEGCDGCFGDYEKLTEADMDVFEKANKLSDSTFVNPTKVSKQIVAGMNYKFMCGLQEPDAKTEDQTQHIAKMVTLMVYKDLDGNVTITSVEELELEPVDDIIKGLDLDELDDLCEGCFGDYEELTEDDMDVFEKASKLSDSTFVNPTKVSKQVVAGMNYKFMCELEVSEGETKDVILEVYKNVKDEIEITSVTEVVEVGFVEPTKEVSISKDCDSSADGLVTNCDVKLGEKN